MSKHRKQDRVRRAPSEKSVAQEKEAREPLAVAEDKPQVATEDQETSKASENIAHAVDGGAAQVPSRPASQANEVAANEAPQLSTALEEEQSARLNERKEKDALKKKLQEAEQEMNRLTKTVEREKRETERQRLHYEGRLRELEQRVAAAQSARRASSSSDESDEGDPASSKATFRIDLYPHQGQFQGKIEHTLTHDKRAFSGIDEAAIRSFIAAHLPPLETKTEELQKILTLNAEAARSKPATQTAAPAATASHAPSVPSEQLQHLASLPGLHLVLAGKRARTNMLRFDQSFDVELDLNFMEEIRSKNMPWDCEVAIFAKRIEGGPRENVGASIHRLAKPASAVSLRVQDVHLSSPGTYRVEALVNMKNVATPAASYTLTTQKLVQVV